MEDIFNSDVHSAIHGEDGKISFVINPSAEDEQFDFGSPSLWGTDQDKSEKPSSKSIINGDDLMAQQEISKLRKSKVEKNRAYLEQNIPYGEESRFFSLFSCLSCALLGRALPEDLERALLNKKVRTDLAGALVPVLLCIIICSCEEEIAHDNHMVGRTLGVTVLIAGWWLAAPWPVSGSMRRTSIEIISSSKKKARSLRYYYSLLTTHYSLLSPTPLRRTLLLPGRQSGSTLSPA